MNREQRIKAILIILGLLFCLYYVYPTVRWGTYDEKTRKEYAGDPAATDMDTKLGRWKVEENEVDKEKFLERVKFSLKKWRQGDRDRVINLGLDLQGGLYVVLEVQLDDAVKVQNQNLRERIRDFFTEEKVEYDSLVVPENKPTVIEMTFTNNAVALNAHTALKNNLDFQKEISVPDTFEGNRFAVRLLPSEQARIKVRALEQARRVVENRVNELGLTEPIIQVQKPDRIIVQLPGEKDPERVRRLLKKTAKLRFHVMARDKLTKRVIESIDRHEKIKGRLRVEPGSTEEGHPYTFYYIENTDEEFFRNLLEDPEVKKRVPANYMILLGRAVPEPRLNKVYREFSLLQKDAAIDGVSLRDAKVNVGMTAADRRIDMKLNNTGMARLKNISRKAEKLYKEQGEVSRLSIVLDDVIYTSPLMTEFIDINPIIKGSFSEQEAADLALVLRSGALPAKMTIVQDRTVGATLGTDSIRRGVRAALIGLACVIVFMAVYYLIAGCVADFALTLNMIILLSVLAFFRATLTLPGIAGIILTIGMAVDANVLIFERIREELAAEKELRRAIKDGFGRAYITIVDANVTTILTALILYIWGTGPIRGFALTLMIGISASMITALFVCRYIFDLLATHTKLKTLRMMQLFRRPNFNFLSKRYIALGLSAFVIIAGISLFTVRARNQASAIASNSVLEGTSLLSKPIYGIDLTGGDMLRLQFSNEVSVAQIRAALAQENMANSSIQEVQSSDPTEPLQVLIRSSFNSSTNAIVALEKQFPDNKPIILEVDRIGPAIGEELKEKAVWWILLALGVIVVYIWWRFEFRFGIAAIIALAHDVLVTLAVFAVTDFQINLGVIAALLTIVGYSLNDTIVVFDRIREDMHVVKGATFKEILNLSINQTLSRTVLTSLTTLFVVLSLFVLGGAVIKDFAFALLVGVITGTYSSIFVASPLLLAWQKKTRQKGRK
jgi:SecD/SecF fusion protein